MADNTELTNFFKSFVNAVSVKPAPFQPNAPDLWFSQLEAQFRLSRVTEESTRFYHVVAALPLSVAHSVRHLALKPVPAVGDYERLKTAIIRAHTPSRDARVEEFLSQPDMGDLTPSQFYRRLEAMIMDFPGLSDDFLFNRWKARLPEAMRPSIISLRNQEVPIETILTTADDAFESLHRPSVANISSQHRNRNSIRPSPPRVRTPSRATSRLRSRIRTRVHNSRRSSSRISNHTCWYHQKYGAAATNCRPPCTFRPAPSNSTYSEN